MSEASRRELIDRLLRDREAEAARARTDDPAEVLARYSRSDTVADLVARFQGDGSDQTVSKDDADAELDLEADSDLEEQEEDASFGWLNWASRFQALKVPTEAEQVQLAQAIEAGVFAAAYLEGSGPPLRSDLKEELQVLEKLGSEAFEAMLIGNLKLVLHWARRAARHIDIEDRFQYGFLGLRRAIQGFDWRRGYAFSTYATWQIRQAMGRGSFQDRNVVRVPIGVQEVVGSDEVTRLMANSDSAWTQESMTAGARVLQGVWSLDAVAELLEDTEDHLDEEQGDPSTWLLTRLFLQGVLSDVLAGLPERERVIMEWRCGYYEDPLTLDEIGKRMGVSRERVRQIENKAKDKLRRALWDEVGPFMLERTLLRRLASEPTAVRKAFALGMTNERGIRSLAEQYEMKAETLTRLIREVNQRSQIEPSSMIPGT